MVAVADAAHPGNPSTAYVINANDRADAIGRVHAHHAEVYGCNAERILTVTAQAVAPSADAWYGWTDLRGIKALRLVLEPGQVRRLARLRLGLRRWNNMMDPYYAVEEATGEQIPPSAWHAYNAAAEAICQAIDQVLFGQGSA
jgi:hypothetical protein